MRGLLAWFRPARGVTFHEARGEVCDTACHAVAAADRARTFALLSR